MRKDWKEKHQMLINGFLSMVGLYMNLIFVFKI